MGPIASGVYGVGASIATGIGVKDYGQCSLPRIYILSGKQYQYGSQLYVYHFLVEMFFIGMLPSHKLVSSLSWSRY